MSLQPSTYEEAKARIAAKPRRPRKPIKRASIQRSGSLSSRSPLEPPKRGILRSGKKSKKKKLTDGQLKKKVWTQFSIFIRTRRADSDGFTSCCTCSTRKLWIEMQAGHFIAGRLNSNLFDERGCNEQCYGCNVGRNGNGPMYYRWMLANHGEPVIDELIRQNDQTRKWNPGELQSLLEHYSKINSENPLVK